MPQTQAARPPPWEFRCRNLGWNPETSVFTTTSGQSSFQSSLGLSGGKAKAGLCCVRNTPKSQGRLTAKLYFCSRFGLLPRAAALQRASVLWAGKWTHSLATGWTPRASASRTPPHSSLPPVAPGTGPTTLPCSGAEERTPI